MLVLFDTISNLRKSDSPHAQGFTLIELLVVIAIIGLLSSVILVSLNTARNKGYDAERFSDLRQMQTILDTYYQDYGSYPVATGESGVWQSMCGSPFNPVAQNNVIMNGATTLVSMGYISAIPKGPVMNTGTTPPSDCYAYKSNGTDYKFMDYAPPNSACLSSTNKLFTDPAHVNAACAVYSPGGSGF